MTESLRVAEQAVVHAFAIRNGVAKPLDLDHPEEPAPDYVWVHVNLSAPPGQRWMKEHSGMPPQLVSDFLNRAEEIEIHPFGHGTLLILEDRVKDFDHDTQDVSELHVWVEPGRIITGRWRPLSAVDRLRFRCEMGTPPATVLEFLAEMLEEITTDMERIGHKMHKSLDDLEDRILTNEFSGMAGRLGVIRREMTTLRRRVAPLRQVMPRLMTCLPARENAEYRQRLDDIQGRIERAHNEVIDTQEQGRLLQDEMSARVSERTNQNVYILSVITMIFMPLNLITGFFGMNVGGIPGVGSDDGFTWVTIGMVVCALITWFLFKMKKWM